MYQRIGLISLAIACVILAILSFYLWNKLDGKQGIAEHLDDKQGSTAAQTSVPVDTTSWDRLRNYISELDKQPEMRHASWGFCMIDVEADSVVMELNADKSLTPASIMKAVTTASAIGMLGPDHRMFTRLQYDGTINKERKTLDGNIYIMGGGDPTLGSPFYEYCNIPNTLQKWMSAIKKLGIDTIKGAIIGDARVFDNNMIPVGWAWEDMQTHYTAPVCGLSFGENQYVVRGRVEGNRVTLTPQTDLPEHTLINELILDKSGNPSYVYVSGMPYMTTQLVKGGVSKDSMLFSLKPHVPDPAYYCAYQLYKALTADSSMVITDSASTVRRLRIINGADTAKRRTFSRLGSQPLKFICGRTNRVSQNYYAETLLKTIALSQKGHGSTYGGSMTVRSYLSSLGIDVSGFIMADGSGLSRFNKVTPRIMSSLLTKMAHDSANFEAYFNSLAIAGQVGTLRNLCKGTAADGNIHGKSGYMTLVRSYTGYVDAVNGKRYAFTMISNNYAYTPLEMRKKFEDIMVLMAELNE